MRPVNLGVPLLPPELCDRTMDFLWDDHRALAACSSTCREWVPTSRFHLFHSVELHNINDCVRFSALLDVPFSSGIARSVRRLSISTGLANHRLKPDRQSARYADVFRASFRPLSTMLSEVESLTLNHSDWRIIAAVYHELRQCLYHASFASKLTALHLHKVRFKDYRDFQQLLVAYPRLSILHIRSPGWSICNPISTINDSRRIRLEELAVVDAETKLALLASALSVPTFELCLRRLQWNGAFDSTEDYHALNNLLQRAAPFLQHLEISLGYFLVEETLVDALPSLAACVNLVTVYFGCDAFYDTTFMSLLLSQLRSPCLQKITFEPFRDHDRIRFRGLDGFPVDRVDKHLARLGQDYPTLSVVFLLPVGDHDPETKEGRSLVDDLGKSLTLAHAAGVNMIARFPSNSRNPDAEYPLW